ncbi:MAG: hypothetical protein J6A61_05895 [Clostridia bacterium]|nr:hypothetical protein [Clostridia bacterium]
MSTKVITLENVRVTYGIKKQKLHRDLLEGLKLIVGTGCLFFGIMVFWMIAYALGG